MDAYTKERARCFDAICALSPGNPSVVLRGRMVEYISDDDREHYYIDGFRRNWLDALNLIMWGF